MTTKNPRINITLEETTANILNDLASREHKSVASVARELIAEALELREDIYLSALADARLSENNKPLNHEDVWK
jgi:predicted DNA-binding protein